MKPHIFNKSVHSLQPLKFVEIPYEFCEFCVLWTRLFSNNSLRNIYKFTLYSKMFHTEFKRNFKLWSRWTDSLRSIFVVKYQHNHKCYQIFPKKTLDINPQAPTPHTHPHPHSSGKSITRWILFLVGQISCFFVGLSLKLDKLQSSKLVLLFMSCKKSLNCLDASWKIFYPILSM